MKCLGTVFVLLALGGVAMGALVSNFDTQPTGTWDPDGSSTYEDWNWKGHPDPTGFGSLVISDTIYHGASGKSMAQVRESGASAPQPYWTMGPLTDAGNNTVKFSVLYTALERPDAGSAGADWVICRNGSTSNTDYISYLRFQLGHGNGDIFFSTGAQIVPSDTIVANTWYDVTWQLDQANQTAIATVTDGVNTWGPVDAGGLDNAIGGGDVIDTLFSYCNGTITTDPIAYIDSLMVVPEPATLGLLALGAVGLLRRRK